MGTDTISFTGGALTLGGVGLTYNEAVTLSTTTDTLDQDGHSTTFAGTISGGGGVTIANTGSGGSVTFNNTETYTGTTTINSGATLKLGTKGNIAKSSSVADSGTFDISGATSTVFITKVTGGGTVSLGTNTLSLSNAGGSFTGNISGSGGVTIAGGSQTFTTAQAYTGTTTVNSGATLALSGFNATLASLAGSGSVTVDNNKTLTLNNASGIFSGVISGAGGGSGAKLTIAGGTEALTGANTYKGTTTINSGATLTGNGSVAGNVSNSGTIRPFGTTSASLFTISGSYTQTSTGILDIAIGGLPATGNYGQLHETGTPSLAGKLEVDTTFNNFGFPVGTTDYTGVLSYTSLSGADFGGGFEYNTASCAHQTGDSWLCGTHLTFSLMTGTGGTTLRVVRTPEPGTIALLASGVLGLLGLQQLKRKRRDAASR